MNIRWALPWLASLAVHAGLLLAPFLVFRAPSSNHEAIALDLTLGAAGSGTQASQATVPGGAISAVREASQPTAPSGPAFRAVGPATGISSTSVDSMEQRSREPPEDSGATRASGQASPAAAGTTGADVGGSPTIGWEGSTRVLLRRSDPRFPRVLSASGLEVDGEARITVAPSGAVVRVEITRSTGYIDIDASVEAALREYLFSRMDGRGDAHGTVRFRFRLEKRD